MGKTEKIVVLSVLFVVVMLFTWSLQSGGTSAKARGGEAAATNNETEGDAKAKPEAGARPLRRGAAENGQGLLVRQDDDALAAAGEDERLSLKPQESGLLTAEVLLKPASTTPAEPAPVKMQPGWDLISTVGLTATVDPGTVVMTPREGATWKSLARDLYGDESKAGLLRHSNEGMATPGALVFVPVKDEFGDAVNERIVEVLEGESLWGVAARTLGSGARWKEIYEANKDVLTDPDFVSPGTRLRIPSGQ